MALSGDEVLYVLGQDAQGRPAAVELLTTTQDIANLGESGGDLTADSVIFNGSTSGTTTVLATAIAGSTTLTLPAATDTLVGKATTDTLTNKTLTAPVLGGTVTGTYTLGGTPTITAPVLSGTATGTYTLGGTPTVTAPVLSGTVTGTYTLGGTPTITAPALSGTVTGTYTIGGTPTFPATVVSTTGTQTLTNKTITGAINTDTVRTSAAVTKNASAAYANVTGLSATVVPGTYKFRCVLPSTVASGTGGIKYAFNYTTTVLTSIESTSMGYTASAVAVQHTTTTTTQTDLFTQAAVVIMTVIEGTTVVGTGGTIDLQVAQNTSNASDTVALVGGSMQFTRIA